MCNIYNYWPDADAVATALTNNAMLAYNNIWKITNIIQLYDQNIHLFHNWTKFICFAFCELVKNELLNATYWYSTITFSLIGIFYIDYVILFDGLIISQKLNEAFLLIFSNRFRKNEGGFQEYLIKHFALAIHQCLVSSRYVKTC